MDRTTCSRVGEVVEPQRVPAVRTAVLRAAGAASHPTRTAGGQRRYQRSVLRRLAFIRAAAQRRRRAGRGAGRARPAARRPHPDPADWSRISGDWRARLDEQIAAVRRCATGSTPASAAAASPWRGAPSTTRTTPWRLKAPRPTPARPPASSPAAAPPPRHRRRPGIACETTRPRRRTTVATPARTSTNGDYTARHLQVLEGLEAVRKRPGMYIGSTRLASGLMHCLWEIIDNAVDEALAGTATASRSCCTPTARSRSATTAAASPSTSSRAPACPGSRSCSPSCTPAASSAARSYAATGGLHGVGASVVNALSARLDVEVDRDGKTYGMSFRRGEPGVFDDSGGTGPPTRRSRRTSSQQRAAGGRQGQAGGHRHPGALLGRPPDLPAGRRARLRPLAARARQTSFLIPGLTLVVRDERGLPGTPGAEARTRRSSTTTAASPSSSTTWPRTPPVTEIWRLQGSGTFTETVPVLDEPGPHELAELTARVRRRRRAALGHRLRHQGAVVRQHRRDAQGRHPRAGLRAGAGQGVPQAAGGQRAPPQGRHATRSEKDDMLAGLTAVVTVRLAEPQFEGQTKEVLGTSAVRAIVAQRRGEGADRAHRRPAARCEGAVRAASWRRSSRR